MYKVRFERVIEPKYGWIKVYRDAELPFTPFPEMYLHTLDPKVEFVDFDLQTGVFVCTLEPWIEPEIDIHHQPFIDLGFIAESWSKNHIRLIEFWQSLGGRVQTPING